MLVAKLPISYATANWLYNTWILLFVYIFSKGAKCGKKIYIFMCKRENVKLCLPAFLSDVYWRADWYWSTPSPWLLPWISVTEAIFCRQSEAEVVTMVVFHFSTKWLLPFRKHEDCRSDHSMGPFIIWTRRRELSVTCLCYRSESAILYYVKY